MPRAVEVDRIRDAVRGMFRPIEDKAFAQQRRQTVQVLDRFRHLHRRDDRGGGRGGRGSALDRRPARQKRTRAALVEQCPIDLAHGAFVAGRPRGGEAAHHPVQDLNTPVKPGGAYARARRVDENPRFAVVHRADHHIGPAEVSQPHVGKHIADESLCIQRRINLHRSSGGTRGLGLALISFSKKD